MLQKFLFSARPWQKCVFYFISYMLLSVATVGFLLCIASFVIVRVDTAEYVLIPLTTFLLTLAAFSDGFIMGKVFKEKGIIVGLSTGVIFAFIITLLAVYYQTFLFSNIYITKICAVLFAALTGGILGVNN